MRLLTLAAGVAVGYVLGTRAGRERYAQIVAQAGRVRDNPTFGQVLDAITDLAGNRPAGGAADVVPPDASLGGTGTTPPKSAAAPE
jgi:hypothetical protein